jgi:hypothetical protein
MSKKVFVVFLSAMLISILACGMLPGTVDERTDSPIEEPQLPDIAGSYTVEGTNADGSSYSGTANITKTNSGYAIKWVIAAETMSGTGTFDGQTYHVVWEASWGTGEAVYNLAPNGALNGTWTTDGVPGQGTEALTPE